MMVGEKLSPVLVEIEETLWESEGKPEFTFEGFRAATKIFMDVIMDKIWELQVDEKIDMETREAMAVKCGEDLRKLIKTYTNLDSFDFYNKK